MTNSGRKKRLLRKMKNWRKVKKDGNWYCKDCGRKIDSTVHHFYCNECWKKRREKK